MSAAPGTGTAIPARVATSKACEYSFRSPKSSTSKWDWSEKDAPQPEILKLRQPCRRPLRPAPAYPVRHARDRGDLRRGKMLAHRDRSRRQGIPAKFCIMAVGALGLPTMSSFKGREDFQGGRSIIPASGRMKGWISPDFVSASSAPAPRRSSRSRSLPQQASALTVFQRTRDLIPCRPGTTKLTPEHRTAIKADYPALAGQSPRTADRLLFPVQHEARARSRPGGARGYMKSAWQRGGLPFLGTFGDLLFEKAANDTIAEFARDKPRLSSGIRPPPICCAPLLMCSAASACASIPNISRPTICRM